MPTNVFAYEEDFAYEHPREALLSMCYNFWLRLAGDPMEEDAPAQQQQQRRRQHKAAGTKQAAPAAAVAGSSKQKQKQLRKAANADKAAAPVAGAKK
jgi:hypothetical protein